MKKMSGLILGAMVLTIANGCCLLQSNCVACGKDNCACDCEPCRMQLDYVKCFDADKFLNDADEKTATSEADAQEVKKAEVNQTVQQAVNETKAESQKVHTKAIPSYAEFVLVANSLRGAADIKEQPEKTITMIFAEKDGQVIVAGCSGVNRYFGNAAITKESNEVKFDKMGSTMMMGPGMEVEKLFLQTLEKVAKYSVVDDKLSFMNANGEILAVFQLKK